MSDLVKEQPAPVHNAERGVWDLVLSDLPELVDDSQPEEVQRAVEADMRARDAEGRRKYGTPLQIHNGRDALVDAYQEALDLVVYLRQGIAELERRTMSMIADVSDHQQRLFRLGGIYGFAVATVHHLRAEIMRRDRR